MSSHRTGRRWLAMGAVPAVAVITLSGCVGAGASSDASGGGSEDAAASGVWTTACDDAVRPANPCGIIDASGREWLLRGVNARIKGVFDVNFDDGREPLEDISAFDESDTAEMKKIGFNLLRLPIQWSGIEPKPGEYDQAYIDKVKAVIDLCEKAGIQVLVDMHQDAYSKEIGEDGAPAWAIVPPPTEPNKGGELNLGAARLSKQTQEAFASFWKNAQVNGKGLQDYFIGAVSQVAEAVKDSPAVLGLEVFNEPWLLNAQAALAKDGADPGLTVDMIYQFYGKAIPALQKIAPDKLIMFEPDVSKNFPPAPGQPPYSATVPNPIPWPTQNTVYAPHFYIQAFFIPGDAAAGYPNIKPDDPNIALNMTNSINEAKGFQAPLLLGEFGFTEKAAQYGTTLDAFYTLADQNVVSSAQWLWKENSQDSWGFYDFADGKPVLRQQAASETARAYPQAISGRMKSVNPDAATGAVSVDFVYKNTGQPHQIFVPTAYTYSGGYTITCSGQEVEAKALDEASGWLSVECGTEDGKEYTLQVQPKSS